MRSLKKNIVYSSLLTTVRYIFPLITYPYVYRVLGVHNIGSCNFVDSVIAYYSIFAMMGINIMGIREIANSNGVKVKLSRTFSSLLLLNLITTFLMIVALIISIFIVPKFYEYRNLMFVGVVNLLFNVLTIEWFYKGLEEFKYITYRSIFVRFVYVVLVFSFVRNANDYVIYYTLSAITLLLNAIINIIHCRKYVSFTFSQINIYPYIKSYLTLGVYAFLTSLYTTFNVAYLGFVSGETEVGYYSTAKMLQTVILALFTAFTGVMLPHMSSIVSDGNKKQFKDLYLKSVIVLHTFSFPLICSCMVFADQIIYWISGPGYEKAVPCMQITLPLIFVIGYEQILIYQILMPLKKDKSVFTNSLIGAIVGLLANVILIPLLSSIGSAIVWVLSEITVLLIAQMYVTKFTGFIFSYQYTFKYLVVSLPVLLLLLLIHIWNPLGNFTLIIGGIIAISYFCYIELYIFKNPIVTGLKYKLFQSVK